ncbi:MAG: hypothetical protein ACR2MP_30040 [Streptosporangiaceae bacterium]
MTSVIMIAILHHMVSRRQTPDVPSKTVTGMAWRSYSLALGFGLSIPVFFATNYAWLLWIVIPLLVRLVHHLHDQQRPRRRGPYGIMKAWPPSRSSDRPGY